MKHNGAQTLISGNHSKDAMAAAETPASEQQDNPGQIMVVERKVHHGPMDTTDHSQRRCHGFATSNKYLQGWWLESELCDTLVGFPLISVKMEKGQHSKERQ